MLNMEMLQIIITEEMHEANRNIIKRVLDLELLKQPVNRLPENQKYRDTLELVLLGKTISEIATELKVSQAAIKKYIDWLRKEGYLNTTSDPISDKEQQVIGLLKEGKSLRQVARELRCSTTNVVYRRNAALAKGAEL